MRKAVLGLAAAATLLAAWFAPDDDGFVVAPAAATPRDTARNDAPAPSDHAAADASGTDGAGAAAIHAAAGLHIQPRIADDDLGDAFAKHSWAPSAPLKPAAATAAAQAEQASAAAAAASPPPLPFQYLGRYTDDGAPAYFFHVDGQNVIARPGEKINDSYVLERANEGTLYFRYLPLNQPQTLVVGDTN